MNWGFVKAFPKFVLVLGVIVSSTVLFAGWWTMHRFKRALSSQRPALVEDVRQKVARIESNAKRLILVDNDLYDLDTGAIVFQGWLKAGTPLALFYDFSAKKVIARYEKGFARYGLDGKEEGVLAHKFQPAFSDDLKWAVYAKEKDLWRADVDWSGFEFINERKLTTIEQFNEQYFAANIMLGTDRTIIVRNMNQLLRVDLESGDVKPTRIPLGEIGKRRSPSGRFLVGLERSQFYCYDLESDETKAIDIGRGAVNDYQWLGNDRCAAIAAGRTVVLYDRLKHTLEQVAPLPVHCPKIGEPSPDGRYVFCIGQRTGFLVDLVNKQVLPVAGGAGVKWVSSDTFVSPAKFRIPSFAGRGCKRWARASGGSLRSRSWWTGAGRC